MSRAERVGQSESAAELIGRILPWVPDFIGSVREENDIMHRAGASEVASIREKVLEKFIQHMTEWLEADVGTREAAELSGCCEETIRRKHRAGGLGARQAGPRGRIQLTREAALRNRSKSIDRRSAIGYDPRADARNIARDLGGSYA